MWNNLRIKYGIFNPCAEAEQPVNRISLQVDPGVHERRKHKLKKRNIIHQVKVFADTLTVVIS